MKKLINKFMAKILSKLPLVCFIIVMAVLLDFGLYKGVTALQDFLGVGILSKQLADCRGAVVVKANDSPVYQYNDQIPVETVKAEIKKQAELFGNDVDFMLKLAKCESEYNNLADNKTSTAKGIYQFVALTWERTESNRQHISEFDYIANIREANIKIANGEYSHWASCLKK